MLRVLSVDGDVGSVSWFFHQFCWHSEDVDRDMDFVMTVVRTIRSLRSDYNLNKLRTDCKTTHTHTHTTN